MGLGWMEERRERKSWSGLGSREKKKRKKEKKKEERGEERN